MNDSKLLKIAEYVLTGLFCTGLFVFFAFFYNHHLHFAGQIQLFLLTGDYFITKMSMPGGFSGYLGEFLTQFYYLPLAGFQQSQGRQPQDAPCHWFFRQKCYF